MSGTPTNVGAPAPTATPTTGAPVATPQAPLDLDALLDVELPLPPVGSKSHSGIDAKAVISALPEDAKKLIANLQSSYTQKTQALSQTAKGLEATQASWLAQQEATLREQAGIPDDVDLFSSDGLQKYVAAKVAEAMLQAQQPLRAKLAADTRKGELQAFKAANPDVDQYQSRIISLLASKQATTPEAAYWIAKGEASGPREAKLQKDLEELRSAQRTTLNKFGVGSTPAPGMQGKEELPKDAYERYQYFKAQKNVK